jgi:hypothetical protein
MILGGSWNGEQLRLAGTSAAAVVTHARDDVAQRPVQPSGVRLVTIWTLSRRSHSMRRNHDGNADSGSPRASGPEGSGSLP